MTKVSFKFSVFYILSGTLLFHALFSFFFIQYYKHVPISSLLDFTFLGYVLVVFKLRISRNKISLVLIALSLLYIGVSFVYAVVINHANALDFLLIYKTFVYGLLFLLIHDKQIIRRDLIFSLFYYLIILFLIKYFILQVTGLDDRPTIFVENNFELMFIFGVYILKYSIEKKIKYLDIWIVFLITSLSLSRSSTIIFIVMVLFLIAKSDSNHKYLILSAGFVIVSILASYIFFKRSNGGSIEDLDRFRFFLVFLENIKDWEFSNYLFGTERITALSQSSCQSLSFYSRLFSYKNDGTCYSVTLHSYILRIIFDHGIVGFAFVLYLMYHVLVMSGLRKELTILFLGLVVLNGLSISSFNNVFFALSMGVILTSKKESVE